MECKTAQTLLEPYLDNELDRSDARELEGHIDGCTECRDALSTLDELRMALRNNALRYTAPQELRDRIEAAVLLAHPGESFTSSGRGRRRRAASLLRIAAACVLAFGAGGISVHIWNFAQASADAETQIEHDLFASHWRALAATSPVDVVSTDRHTVKPWFAGKIAEAPLVQDFANQGFALVGGRMDYVGSERVAVLVYRHGQHLVDVFVLPREGGLEAGREARRQGYSLHTTALGGQSATVVSDMDDLETVRFMSLLASIK